MEAFPEADAKAAQRPRSPLNFVVCAHLAVGQNLLGTFSSIGEDYHLLFNDCLGLIGVSGFDPEPFSLSLNGICTTTIPAFLPAALSLGFERGNRARRTFAGKTPCNISVFNKLYGLKPSMQNDTSLQF